MSQDYTVAKELASLKEIKQSAEQRISELSLNALNYVNDHRLHKESGGNCLPEVTAEDDGDVLTVVDGAWGKAAPSGGGVTPFGFNTYIVNFVPDNPQDDLPAATGHIYVFDGTFGDEIATVVLGIQYDSETGDSHIIINDIEPTVAGASYSEYLLDYIQFRLKVNLAEQGYTGDPHEYEAIEVITDLLDNNIPFSTFI